MTLPSPIQYHIYHGQPLQPPAFYSYILAQQGVFKWVRTDCFDASILVAPGSVAGLAPWPENIILNVPPIPVSWLYSVLEHARRAAGDQSAILRPIEQMYHFHCLDPDGWRVALPKQEASPARVKYKGGDAASIVLDLHSHHGMPAYFSDTDNRDEQGCRFYAVIGQIYSRPQITLRLGIWGDFVTLPALTLFEALGPFRD